MQGIYKEKYLKTHPEVPEHIARFWYPLSFLIIFILLGLAIFNMVRPKPAVIESSTTQYQR